MRRTLFILLSLSCVVNAAAQIKTVTTAVPPAKQPTKVEPYDGKSNLSKHNMLAHKGETLYLLHNQRKDTKGYALFFTKPGFDQTIISGTNNAQSVYKPVADSGVQYSDAQAMRDRYYYVNDVVMEDTSNIDGKVYLQLIEKESHDTLYYRTYPSMSHRFLTVRYFESLQKEYTAKKYYVRNTLREININTGEQIEIPRETPIVCKELAIDDGRIIYIMEAAGLGRFKATNGEMNQSCDLESFETPEEYNARKNNKSPNAAKSSTNFNLKNGGRTIVY